MPDHCDVSIAQLSSDEFREVDFRVMRHAFDSQNDLGRLADERIYQADLARRLESAGMIGRREVEIRLSHREYRKSLFLDLVVDERAVYELKVVHAITDVHIGQLLTYLHLLDLRHGKLINFRSTSVETQFVNAPLTAAERRAFTVNDAEFDGDRDFRDLVVALLRDWGTSLTLVLYHEAVVSLLGGIENVEAMLPMSRDGQSLGRQRFCLAGPDTAFRITAMNRNSSLHRKQLERLMEFSPLRAIQWVNIGHHEVTFTTIDREN